MSEESTAICKVATQIVELNGNLAAIHGAIVGLQKCVISAGLETKPEGYFENEADRLYTVNMVHAQITKEEF